MRYPGRPRLTWSAATLLLCLFAVSTHAQELIHHPDKPKPVVDHAFIIATAALGTAWTLDTVSTHQWMVGPAWHHEVGAFFPGSRSTPKIMGAWAAVDIGAVVISYEWKKHVRNRYLHPLWQVLLIDRTSEHTMAAIGNWTGGHGR
jgi:hypothetical protein